LRRWLLLVVLACLPSGGLWATSAWDSDGLPVPQEEQARLSARLVPSVLRPGEHPRLEVQVETELGWHLYSVFPPKDGDAPPPTKLVLNAAPLTEDGPLYETRAEVVFDQAIQMTLATHEELAYLYQNLTVPPEVTLGEHRVLAQVSFQVCSFRVCLPPKTQELTVTYRLESGPVREEYQFANRAIDPLAKNHKRGKPQKLGQDGLWTFVGLAALMGLASLIMPCVFPMVPITISYFSKQAQGNPKGLLWLAGLFGFGIIVTYTGMGLVLSSVFGAGASSIVASNPWVNLGIAGLFITFALSLMGLFSLDISPKIQTYFDHKARSAGGALGVILMGFTFTLTAFTCTVQFVGTLMIAASQGQWAWPLLGMLVFSTVFAFPFFLLALAPGMVGRMQKSSGDWLGRSKVVLGILELMASLKFLSNADLVWQTGLLSRDLGLLLWSLCLLGAAIYLGVTGKKTGKLKKPGQGFWILVFLVLAGLTWRGRGDHSLGSLLDSLLPPAQTLMVGGETVSAEESAKLVWLDRLEPGLEKAKATQKPVLLEFTGYTCVNCRWMEQHILPLKSVHPHLAQDFVLVRLYTDGGERGPENLNLQINRFSTVALPLYLILSPEGAELARYVGISLESEDFVKFLAQAGK